MPERRRYAHLRTGVLRRPSRNDLMLAAGAIGWASTMADEDTTYSVALEIMAARAAGARAAKKPAKRRKRGQVKALLVLAFLVLAGCGDLHRPANSAEKRSSDALERIADALDRAHPKVEGGGK